MGAEVSRNCCGPREKESAPYLEAPPRAASQYLTEGLVYSEQPLSRSCCQYGDGCQRQNPMHFVEESHPGDPDYQGREAGRVSVPVVKGGPLLNHRQQSFDWIRMANEQQDRKLRAETASLTLKACRGCGYQLQQQVVPLRHIDALLEGTVIVTLEQVASQLPPSHSWWSPSAPRLRLSQVPTAFDAALHETNGAAVAVVGAASAYHPCGGFRTGGRHALEESMCVQSTLCVSLQRALFLSRHGNAKVSPPARVGKGWFCYIPETGAIVSPHVEVFRTGSNEGYAFLQKPRELAAVVSVAMPNKNSNVKDSPLDAPSDPKEYKDLLVSKFKVALGAAVLAGATKCVVPGAGCGVFKNDPGDVGAALAEAVQWPPICGKLEEVILAGVPRAFATAAGAVR